MFDGFGLINKYFEKLDKKRNISYEIDKELKEQLSNWGGKEYFEDVLYKVLELEFNIDKDKMIYLKRIITKEGLSFYWDYNSNVNSNNRIDFRIGPGFTKHGRYTNPIYEITLSWNQKLDYYRRRYVCDGDVSKKEFKGFEVEKLSDYFVKIVNGIKYTRMQEESELTIIIENGDDKVKLACRRRIEDKLMNEEELIQYLVDTVKSGLVNLEDIFNKTYEIAFSDGDVSGLKLYLYRNEKVVSTFEFDEFKYDKRNIFERNFKISNKGLAVRYTRFLPYRKVDSNRGNLMIRVENGDYRFVLDVKLDNNCEVVLDNEIELRKYLGTLEFPVIIEDVYKNICEMSLGDISRYALIEVKVAYKNVATDVISIENGKLNLFHIIRDDKEITIDKTGYFTYKREDILSKMYISLYDNMVTKCEYVSEKPFSIEIDGVMENPLQKGIIEAKNERNKTKKLVDRFIKNERRE